MGTRPQGSEMLRYILFRIACFTLVITYIGTCILQTLAICDPPRGYIFSYNSTLEGATVEFACQKLLGNLSTTMTAVCNHSGSWDPNPTDVYQSGM